MAIIIKTGTKKQTSVEIANQILKLNKNENMNDLQFLQEISIEQLKNIKGIGKVKAIQIKAICEISARMNKANNYRKIQIKTPDDVARLLMNELRFEKREIVKLLILNNKNLVLKILDIAIGTGNFATLNVREILSEVIKTNAPRMILAHNHPSGDERPSRADFQATIKIAEAAKILNIQLLDHIVIGNMRYESIMNSIEWKKINQNEREWY